MSDYGPKETIPADGSGQTWEADSNSFAAMSGYAPDPREMEFALRAIMRGCEREAEVKFGDARYASVMTCYKLARDGLGYVSDQKAHSDKLCREAGQKDA